MTTGQHNAGTVLGPTLTEALRRRGRWTTIYTDSSMATEDPRGVAEGRRRSVLDTVSGFGLTDDQLASLADALAGTDGVPSPSTRYALLLDGELVHSVNLPGRPVQAEVTAAGAVPQLLPLLRHRGDEITYVVVEAAKDGGEVSVFRSTSTAPTSSESLQGRTDAVHKFKGGGWAHLRYQHHTEDVWRQNETEIAAVVERLVAEHSPGFVLVTGDPQPRQLLEGRLSSRAAALVTSLDVNTRAAGSSPDAIGSAAEARLEELADAAIRADLDRLGSELGHEGGAAARGVEGTIDAIRQAQVETLLLVPDALEDRTLLALAEEPWVAVTTEDAGPADVLGEVPAAEALARAAVFTDAAVRLVPGALLADSAGAAALLRWGTPPSEG